MAAVRAFGLLRCGVGNGILRLSRISNTSCYLKKTCCSYSMKNMSRRLSTTTKLLIAENDNKEPKEPSTWFSNLLGYTQDESENQVMDPEEMKEREALFAEIADMYFAKPRQLPDLKFIEKVVDFLIKHNDEHGVKTVWVVMQDMKLEPPEELIVKMEEFLAKAREEAWFN